MERKKILRAIRISAAALCFLMSLLVVALWIRSHYHDDGIVLSESPYTYLINKNGVLGVVSTVVPERLDYVVTYPYPVRNPKVPGNFGFYFWLKNLLVVTIPHWFAAFAVGGSGIVLLKGRFSIRLLLVVTTIFAVVLGLMMYRRT